MSALIPILIGILCLFLAKFIREDWHVLSGTSVAVEAVVAEQASRQTSAGGGMSSRGGGGFQTTGWAAVYRFTAPDGTVHAVTDPVWSTNQGGLPAIGSTRTLRYPPGSPQSAAPYTFARRFWAYAAVSMFIAALTYAWLNPTTI